MYSKLVVGFAMAGAATAAGIVRRDTGAGGHSHDHGSSGYAAPPASYSAPEPSYAAPAPSYDAPAPSYGAPAPSYGAPAPSYGAPAPSYGAPAPSYGAPAPVYGYEEDEGVGFCIECIIIPWLILFGLSLLFPTITSVAVNNSGRKKREGKIALQ
jgi:hypothetical protein